MDRAKLIKLLRQVEVDLINAKQNCENYDLSKDIRYALESIESAIEEVQNG